MTTPHADPRVQRALVALQDALVTFERDTRIRSVLILRQEDGFCQRLIGGRPAPPEATDVDVLLAAEPF